MSQKMLVVDLDGTLVDLHTPWCRVISEKLNVGLGNDSVEFKPSDVTAYDMDLSVMAWGRKQDPRIWARIQSLEAMKLLKGEDVRMFGNLQMYPHVDEVLYSLRTKGYRVFIATAARSGEAAAYKVGWIKENLVDTHLIHPDDWAITQCKEVYEGKLWIDDAPEVAKRLDELNKPAITLSHNYVDPKLYKHVFKTWKGMDLHIDAMLSAP